LSDQATWPDSPEGGTLGDGRNATATLRPLRVEELCHSVSERVALGDAIYPQGGRTALDYGGVPRRPGVAIDTTGISRLIDYPFADMTITVEAGMTLSALRAILFEQGQRPLVEAPEPDRATLGGIYATNTSGSRRYAVGRPRDQIIGVSFVTSVGVVVKGGGRVVKNVAGYDFPKLLTGSMGTLGIITQLTLKVRPMPEALAIVWVPFWNPRTLAETLDQLNKSGTRPVALDFLNGSGARTVGQGLGLPTGQGILAIGYEDNAASVRWQIDRLKSELGRTDDIAILEGAESQPLWKALADFQAASPGPVGFVANLRPSSVASFVEALDPERWMVQAHAGNGIVRAHAQGDWTLDDMGQQIKKFRSQATRDGGNLILARCSTAWKDSLHVWGQPRPDWAIAERVKVALDPHAAMNPGRFVGRI
jgi:glycolate oxidase FAD binding subunit